MTARRCDRLANAAIVLVWRLGLGWLAGRRLLLVTTVGRHSGEPHRVALHFAQQAGIFYVAAWDQAADWHRNVVRQPAVTMQAWPGPRAVRARPVDDPEEAAAIRRLWRRRAPRQLAMARRRAGDEPKWLALEPTGQRTPEMVPPDLVWVWPVLAIAAWLGHRLAHR